MELIWVRKIGMIHLKHFQENDFLKQVQNFSIKVSKLLKRVKLVLDLLSCSNFAGADELILSKNGVNTLDKLKTNATQKKILCWTQPSLNDGGQYCEWTMDSGQNHKGNKPCDLLVHGLATIQKRIKRMLTILHNLRWFVREGCHCPKKPLTPPPSPLPPN